MPETDRIFSGSIPALYDRYMRPMIFEPYAADLARRLADFSSGDLLEIAAGTGVLTNALRLSLPKTVTIVATDLNQPMVDFAAARSDARVTWRQADALHLPFADSAFDVVVCQFGAMFFPDKVAAYRETLRVLRPGGRFVFNVWDRIEDNDFGRAVSEGVAAIFPHDPPQFIARTPHGYHDKDRVKSELHAAGFSQIQVETVSLLSQAPSCYDPAIGFCQGSPLRSELEARGPNCVAEATEAAAAMVRTQFGDGPIRGKMQAHVIIAAR
ncbi:MAG TPA: methyltransferase domain-containing protein [Alphaproteobacteria bacterium]|nr:methyltransferase domain-containing protein [Alphaproteobacteria bacterium]